MARRSASARALPADISASSKKNTTISVGGGKTTTGDDPRKRALQAAADPIASYIASHRAASPK